MWFGWLISRITILVERRENKKKHQQKQKQRNHTTDRKEQYTTSERTKLKRTKNKNVYKSDNNLDHETIQYVRTVIVLVWRI